MEFIDSIVGMLQGWLAWGLADVEALPKLALLAGSAGATFIGTAVACRIPNLDPLSRLALAIVLTTGLFVIFLGTAQFAPDIVDTESLVKSQGVR